MSFNSEPAVSHGATHRGTPEGVHSLLATEGQQLGVHCSAGSPLSRECTGDLEGAPDAGECRIAHKPGTMPAAPRPSETLLGTPKLPARYAAAVLPLLLSVLMTCIVSLVTTLRGIGWAPNFLEVWLSAWALSWLIAFPTLLVALPLVRRATAAIVRAA